MTTVSIIVPVYNEEATILEILKRVKAQSVDGFQLETIVVDDGSKDQSVPLLKAHPELYTKLIALEKNGGKGAAVKAALGAATGEFVLFQDADLEYDPRDYAEMFMPIRDFDADVVIGSRFLAPRFTRVFYFWNRLGNWVISNFFNFVQNTTFTDIYSCYFLYRRVLVDPAELRTMGWEQQAEILSIATARGQSYYEVPISYQGRSYEEGKKIRAWHAIGVLWTTFRMRLRRGRLRKKRVLKSKPAVAHDEEPAPVRKKNRTGSSRQIDLSP